MTALDRVLNALHQRGIEVRKVGKEYVCRCPAHDDRTPSLNLTNGGGSVVVICRARCRTEDVLAALGLEMRDLYDAPAKHTNGTPRPAPPAERRHVATIDATEPGTGAPLFKVYDYTLDAGTTKAVKARFNREDGTKGCLWFEADPAGGFWRRLGGRKADLYRRAEVEDAIARGALVLLNEGERAVDAVLELAADEVIDFAATCGPNGAESFGSDGPRLAAQLRGARVWAVVDRDDAGDRWAAAVREHVGPVAAELRLFHPAVTEAKADLRDHIEAGHRLSDLVEIDAPAPTAPLPAKGVRRIDTPGGPPRTDDRTELANAERFAREHGDVLRYCYELEKWLVWTGTHWRQDSGAEVELLAQATARRMLREAVEVPGEDARKAAVRHAQRSESAKAISNMIALAQPMLRVDQDELDRDPFALNVQNGTVDLRTGRLRRHDPAELHSKVCPVEYHPDARSPIWDKVVSDALPDEATRAFVQRAFGHSATGDVSEEKMFMPIGPGASGKSTILQTGASALGDYAVTADFETFLQRPKSSSGGPRSDIARLVGARFVLSVEVEDGRKLAAGLVKTMTGGDVICARGLYRSEIQFRPTLKLWLCANDAPRIRHEDAAMWRRVCRVPFDRVVPEAERDLTLKTKLREPEHLAAVLAWIVAGAVAWHREGLAVPKTVTTATEGYRAEMDWLRGWLEDCCELGDELWTPAKTLRDSLVAWCAANGETPPKSSKALAAYLHGHGCTEDRRFAGRGWRGISLTGGNREA